MNDEQNGANMEAQSNVPVGLMANGHVGNWELAVDESTSGPDRWFLQIEGPSVFVYFEIETPSMIDTCLAFMEDGEPPQCVSGEVMTLGRFAAATVDLRRDNEFDDRFFLCVDGVGVSAIRFSLTGGNVAEFIGALRQIVDQFKT